jgi:N-methylhydantoinase B
MVDTLFRALARAAPLRIPSASPGTMNNLTLGAIDRRHGGSLPFAYYETIAGGMRARPGLDGASAIHTHMTKCWNTPSKSSSRSTRSASENMLCGVALAA